MEQGYPITRATIAKIESNSRNSKVDVAEVLTLAAALEVSPRDLMFHGYPDRKFRATPRVEMTVGTAQQWFKNGVAYNEYDGLHQPKLAQTKAMESAISDYNNAWDALENRYQFVSSSRSNDYFINESRFGSAGELKPGSKAQLEREYEQLEQLRKRVLRLGGYVDLPPWFGTMEVVPF